MGFKLGTRSLGELEGVHPDLAALCKASIGCSPVDFGVFDGIRTAADQNALYKRRASQIDGYNKIGRHQVQPSGYGHAVDLVPWIGGRFQWDWDAIYDLTDALHMCAVDMGIHVRWGGCWQHINPLQGTPENWVAEYVKRRRSQGRRAFNDGPHFELYGAHYNADQPEVEQAEVAV